MKNSPQNCILALLLCGLLLLSLAGCVRGTGPEPPAETAAPELPPEPTEEVRTRTLEPADAELVCVTDYIPDCFIELRYSTPDNFTGRTIYDFSDAWLRYGTVKKLLAVQTGLRQLGLSLKLWDAYRPAAAQFRLWEVVPDPAYVANPYAGHSAHSNGGTVDLTLVTADGTALEMPTCFDDFSSLADRDYSDVSRTARENALLLERAMEGAGFAGYSAEWWHFSDSDSYPYEDLEQIPFPLDREALFEAAGTEALPLNAAPEEGSEVLERVPAGERFQIVGWAGAYARVEWQGRQGYAPASAIRLTDPAARQ